VSQEGGGYVPEHAHHVPGALSLEYLLTFTFCMCRVWNTELLLQREPGGGGSVPEHAHSIRVCRVWNIRYPIPFACAESGILNYYSNVSQEGEDLFLSTLTVSRVRSSSYGEYTCRALNTMGAVRTSIRMQPKGITVPFQCSSAVLFISSAIENKGCVCVFLLLTQPAMHTENFIAECFFHSWQAIHLF
jgi:hypothetical protein